MDRTKIRSSFEETWTHLSTIGGDPASGYNRFAFTDTDQLLRSWFRDEAERRDLVFEVDRNTNMWAWPTTAEAEPVVATGSHLDSVPGGGPFDGPLGVVSAFLAVDVLRERSSSNRLPVVVCFTEEEGGRFGVACLGSKLLTGAVTPSEVGSLTDGAGVSLVQAAVEAGFDPGGFGPEPERLQRLSCFVELHCEQGRTLDQPFGLASAVWPHGRWRYTLTGEPNHAGTTPIVDRRDPMLVLATLVTSARTQATTLGGVATVGRMQVLPNATNAVAETVTAWLDARAADGETLETLVAAVDHATRESATKHLVDMEIVRESYIGEVRFDGNLNDIISRAFAAELPVVATAAGHDAAILSAHIPSTMLFVRNPSGASHTPSENIEIDDCVAGVEALADAVEALSWT